MYRPSNDFDDITFRIDDHGDKHIAVVVTSGACEGVRYIYNTVKIEEDALKTHAKLSFTLQILAGAELTKDQPFEAIASSILHRILSSTLLDPSSCVEEEIEPMEEE